MQQTNPVVDEDNTRRWFENGLLHRLGGPAIMFSNGDKCWFENGVFHRLHSPAIEYASGDEYWYRHGKLHRTDGPAVTFMGDNYWYVDDVRYSKDAFQLIAFVNSQVTV